MTNIVETSTWESGVYQFETADPIQGGVDGVDNLPHKQLGNRTLWLKTQVDALNALKGKTIPEFSAVTAYASGEIVSYSGNIYRANSALAAGVWNASNWTALVYNIDATKLNGQLPAYYLDLTNATGTLASARLTGTYAISVSGNSATATTLQTARTINGVSFNGSANITIADATKLPLAGGNLSGGVNITTAATINTLSTAQVTLSGSNDAIMCFNRPGLFTAGFGVDANNVLVYGGSNSSLGTTHKVWHDGVAQGSIAANGYQKLPNGMIMQWGSVQLPLYTTVNSFIFTPVTFPISFISNLHQLVGSLRAGISQNTFTNHSLEDGSLTGFTDIYSCGQTGFAPIVSYIAIGK